MLVSPSCRGQPGRLQPAPPTLDAVRELAPHRPTSEFPAFCEAVRTWLRGATCLDPSLAAVADLVAALPPGEEQLAHLASDAANMHAVLGASALLSLWRSRPR